MTADIQATKTSKLKPTDLGHVVPSDWSIRLVRGRWPAKLIITDERLQYYSYDGVMRRSGNRLTIIQAYGWAYYRVVERDVVAAVWRCELKACILDLDYSPESNAAHWED